MSSENMRKPFNLKPLGARLNPDAKATQCVCDCDFTGCTLEEIKQIAMAHIVVEVQNAQRKNWASIKPGQVFKTHAKKHVPGGVTLIDPVEYLKSMSKEDRQKYLKENGLL